jgi:hypothetical protein
LDNLRCFYLKWNINAFVKKGAHYLFLGLTLSSTLPSFIIVVFGGKSCSLDIPRRELSKRTKEHVDVIILHLE